jgi:putative membrane protein
MSLELLLFTAAGCFLGILTGMVPGLHVNTIALIALGIPGLESKPLMVLIAGMSVVHTFVDFIPSILLGAPDEDNFLAVLPGHAMLLQGKGIEAIRLTVAGGIFAGIAAIIASPIFLMVVEKGRETITASIPFALGAILAAMVLEERGKKALLALAVVALSGALGFIALGGSLPLHEPLFCLAAGFFGASALADSIMKKAAVGMQEDHGFAVEKGVLAKNTALALAGACLVSLFPGIGASQAAFIARKAIGKISAKSYLVLLGGVNTATMILSFFVLFSWGKARTGSAAAIAQLGPFGLGELLTVVAACLFGIGFGAMATNAIAGSAMRLVRKIDYRKANIAVLALVTALVFAFSGWLGLAFYAVAAAIGLVSINAGIKRSNAMAFLMVPAILRYAALA